MIVGYSLWKKISPIIFLRLLLFRRGNINLLQKITELVKCTLFSSFLIWLWSSLSLVLFQGTSRTTLSLVLIPIGAQRLAKISTIWYGFLYAHVVTCLSVYFYLILKFRFVMLVCVVSVIMFLHIFKKNLFCGIWVNCNLSPV